MLKKLALSTFSLIFTVNLVNAMPPGFALTTVTTGLSQAITIRFAPDGRMFYLEQYNGRVRTMSNVSGNFVLNTTIWATIPVDATGERGLLGITFDPNFGSTNRYIYFYHSISGSANNRVIRMTEDTTTFTGTQSTTIIDILDNSPGATNHNGGNLTFGPDGMLYITAGDGGGVASNSQSDTTLQGKILRVNPYGTLPVPYSVASQLFYCKGLRNSFDMAWNPVNNVLYASENGPSTDDEVNRIVQGANYGWPIYMGYTNVTSFSPALFDFSNSSTVAPTGICFYPASGNFPVQYQNNMFVVDVNYGNIWRFILGNSSTSLDTVTFFERMTTTNSITYADIEPGPDGALYLAAFSRIMKLSYTTPASVESWQEFDKPAIRPDEH